MRWLCLHGTGSSATIFQQQLASICHPLQKNHTFHFIDAYHPCAPAAGIDLHYPEGPHTSWWTNPGSVSKIREACKRLHNHFIEHSSNPYGGVISFSRGCLLLKSYILFHQAEKPAEPLPFQAAVFLCGGPVLSVLEELGISVSPTAWDWDKRTKIALRERASSKAIQKYGKDRWLTPGGNGDGELNIDPSTPINPTDVYGLDVSRAPEHLRIRIPTVHLYGRVDPRFPASMQLMHLCDPETRLSYQHEGGHNIPKSSATAEGIAEVIDQCARMAENKANA
ncbi:hypothetical protein FQN54_004554 [Arachnomyces sp. PD_36]|nr:hypothetical protein FQN54_004554 [Arachnomyces sp. PD_36]